MEVIQAGITGVRGPSRKPADAPEVMSHKDKQGGRSGKSRVTNGKDLLPGVTDERSPIARRFRDIVNAIVANKGGLDKCSEVSLQLIRRFAATSALAERLEGKLVNGDDISITEHSNLASTSVRLAQRIGIEHIIKDGKLRLSDFIGEDEES